MKYAIVTVLGLLLPQLSLAGGHVSEGVKIEPMLSTMTSPLGNKLEYPEGDARIISAKVIIPPDGQVNRHTHPAPFYGHILQGSLTSIYDDGTMKTHIAGESFVESSSDPIVRAVNLGTMDMVGIIVFMGADGMTPSTPAAPLE